MDIENSKQERTGERRVWLDRQERIASFHEMENYELRILECHDDYVSFLHTLQEQGFRFQ